MAYRGGNAGSSAGSHTPSPSSSTNVSPYIDSTPLASLTDDHDSSYSAHGTPDQSTTSLPRTLNAGKGGCWTCRVRRKKCDEQREGDSCKTCKRLTIKCLGWGAKRPEWMRDKKHVDAYKASIKAQLSRAGLIRGQPRHNPMQVSPHRGVQQQQPIRATTHNSHSSSVNVNRSSFEPFHHQIDPSFNTNSHLVSGMPAALNSGFDDQLSRAFDPFDPASGYYAQNTLFNQSLGIDNHDFGLPHTAGSALFADSSIMSPYPTSPVKEELVMHYFNNVQRIQPNFAGEALTDMTYSAIVEEPRGPVTLAVCALADTYSRQTRISEGLEAPNHSNSAPDGSSKAYLINEALLRLENRKNANGCWSDNDAIAALHLISHSQLSGGGSDWDQPFTILCQWLHQTGLHLAENPRTAFLDMTPTIQHYVKATLWLDVISSLSVMRPPKFLLLWQAFLGEQPNFFDLEMSYSMRMDVFAGCPDEAVLAIAETSALAHWKTSQIRNGCLSYPDLIHRGTIIEQRLRRCSDSAMATNGLNQGMHGTADASSLTVEERAVIAKIFREAADLYLHSVLSNSTPGVPEIGSCVQKIVQLFSQLPPSEVDRTLVFPICLAGCMTNDSTIRDFFKGRLRALDESRGNLLQTRRLMEAVWQKRDIGGKDVDFREMIKEQGLKLLLI